MRVAYATRMRRACAACICTVQTVQTYVQTPLLNLGEIMPETDARKTRPKGIPEDVSALLFERAEGKCERCGKGLAFYDAFNNRWAPLVAFSRQHRQARGSGGTKLDPHRIQNLALLCGSATTGCHGVVENQERAQGTTDGWVVRHGITQPEDVPIQHWSLGRVWLTSDGGYSELPPALLSESDPK